MAGSLHATIDRLLGTPWGRLLGAALVLGGTMCCYWWLNRHLEPRISLRTPLDDLIPFLPWTILIYLSYAGPMIATAWYVDAREFRKLTGALLLANGICYVGFALFTAHIDRPALETIDPWVRPIFAWLRGNDGAGNTFPSTHVAVTTLLALRLARRPRPWLWIGWAVAIDLSTLLVKQHFVVDVIGGSIVAFFAHAAFFPAPAPAGRPDDLRPLHRLNVGLVLGLVGALWGLQALASHLPAGPVFALFAFLMVPLYTLIHEGEHRLIHPDKRVNDTLGMLAAATFGASFTFLRACHMGHHVRNRTDAEMFDEYYPHESRAKKWAWFLYLYLGGFWLAVALSNVVLLVWPGFCRTQLLQNQPSAAAMVNGVSPALVRRVRLECLGVMVYQAALFWALDLRIGPYLLLYSAHGLWWSSHNYLNHAGSPRHVLNGAHNLRTHPWLERFTLNFNWHLAHHQHPSVPWHLLPHFDDPTRERPEYLSSLLRFWRGPRLTTEPSPRELSS